MNYQEMSPAEKRAYWWQSRRNDFVLYAPLPIAIILVVALGVGSSFTGLYPGVNTHTATLSGAGAPWIGLVILLVIAGLWYWVVLREAYSLSWMAVIVGCAIVLDLLVNTWALGVLVVEQPDAFIGGLGVELLFGPLLFLTGVAVGEEFLLGVLMGAFMGVFLGGLGGLPIGFGAMLIMVLIYGPVGALAGGLGGILRPIFTEFLKKRRMR